jgi:hypothetical protein
MVYAVHGLCAFNTAVRRDLVVTNLTTRLVGESTWGRQGLDKVTNPQGEPALAIEARFLLRLRADLFWTDLIAELGTGLTGPRPGSRIWRHDCTHDELNRPPCTIADERTW